MQGVFDGDNQQSASFVAGRGGVDIGLTMTGTNSVTVQQLLGGVWYTAGAAITATGRRHLAPGVDYGPGATFRLNCATHDTDDIDWAIEGDVAELAAPDA